METFFVCVIHSLLWGIGRYGKEKGGKTEAFPMCRFGSSTSVWRASDLIFFCRCFVIPRTCAGVFLLILVLGSVSCFTSALSRTWCKYGSQILTTAAVLHQREANNMYRSSLIKLSPHTPSAGVHNGISYNIILERNTIGRSEAAVGAVFLLVKRVGGDRGRQVFGSGGDATERCGLQAGGIHCIQTARSGVGRGQNE